MGLLCLSTLTWCRDLVQEQFAEHLPVRFANNEKRFLKIVLSRHFAPDGLRWDCIREDKYQQNEHEVRRVLHLERQYQRWQKRPECTSLCRTLFKEALGEVYACMRARVCVCMNVRVWVCPVDEGVSGRLCVNLFVFIVALSVCLLVSIHWSNECVCVSCVRAFEWFVCVLFLLVCMHASVCVLLCVCVRSWVYISVNFSN